MQAARTHGIPDRIRVLLEKLITMDQNNGQPSVLPKDDTEARQWLTEVLLDAEARRAHVDFLKAKYQRQFHVPAPYWERTEERLSSDPTSGFPCFDLGPKQALLLSEGPSKAALSPTELARLVLDPFLLYELAERIDAEMPDWWLQMMDARGKAWLEDQGIRLFAMPTAAPAYCTTREAAQRKKVPIRVVQEALERGDLQYSPGQEPELISLESLDKWNPPPPRWHEDKAWTTAIAASSKPEDQEWTTRQTRKGTVLLIGDPTLLGASPPSAGDRVRVILQPTRQQVVAQVRFIADDIVVLELETEKEGSPS